MSDHHKKLKKYIAENPQAINLPVRAGPGTQKRTFRPAIASTFLLPFSIRTAVEVKSRISPLADIDPGLYQCVKYRAVLNACIAAEGKQRHC